MCGGVTVVVVVVSVGVCLTAAGLGGCLTQAPSLAHCAVCGTSAAAAVAEALPAGGGAEPSLA